MCTATCTRARSACSPSPPKRASASATGTSAPASRPRSTASAASEPTPCPRLASSARDPAGRPLQHVTGRGSWQGAGNRAAAAEDTPNSPDDVCENALMSDPHRDMMPMHEAQHSFDVVLRGYDRNQVAETIERLEADFRIALADRDAAVARSADLASQLSAMHGEIESLRRKAATAAAPTFENMSERISHMLRLAEEEATEIRRSAEQEAQAVREQTAAEERAMQERHAAGQAEVERMIAEARQAAEQIASKAQIRADELVQKAQERVARLDAESQARRAKVEEDFDIAQRARRAEAARQDEERERVSTEAARQRVASAEQHAAQLVAEAEARAEAIRAIRDELTGRLLQARQLLTTLPDLSDQPAQAEAPEKAPERAAQPSPAPTANRVADVNQAPATPATESERRPQPAAPATAPAPTTQPARGEGEAAAARQPTRTAEPATRQLPMPPRTTGSTAAPVGPQTQAIDAPAGQGRPRHRTPQRPAARSLAAGRCREARAGCSPSCCGSPVRCSSACEAC